MKNQLFYGDNLTIMQEMPDYCADLIYLDPPFNSKKSYNMMYKKMTDQPVPEQVEAFCDTWTLDPEKEDLVRKMPIIMREYGMDHAFTAFWENWIQALRNTQPSLLAYLVYMTVRLLEMKRKLKPTGSIYLHCDPTASHYIKVMMDGIFGHKNFRNEIVWGYKTGGLSKRWFGKKHDTILFYVNSDKNAFFKTQYYKSWQAKKYNYNEKYPELFDAKEKKWYHLSICRDVWEDINPLGTASKERLGYPTQKPVALLNRIIEASCPEDGIVFDPFCGCGTSIYAAHELKRNWIGCDIAMLSIQLVKRTLEQRYGLLSDKDYKIDGVPVSTEQAVDLFERDPFQFQHWAIERVGGFCNNKKTADKGIDGRIYFETNKGLKNVVISVKGGHIKPSDIRDLRGVMEREDSSMAGFISLKEPTKAMKEEAATAGIYEYHGMRYPKIQLLTVADILEKKKFFKTPNMIGQKDPQLRFVF